MSDIHSIARHVANSNESKLAREDHHNEFGSRSYHCVHAYIADIHTQH